MGVAAIGDLVGLGVEGLAGGGDRLDLAVQHLAGRIKIGLSNGREADGPLPRFRNIDADPASARAAAGRVRRVR